MISKMAVRHAISGVLKEHDIDDLALECELATSVYGFFERLANGENEHIVEGDMFDQFTRQHAELRYQEELLQRIGSALKINIKNDDKWEPVVKFLSKKERDKQQTIETFASWLEDFKFGPPVWKITMKPGLIIEIWPQAFPEGTQLPLLRSESGGIDL